MSLYPYTDKHSIQSAAFVLEWSGALDKDEIAQIAALHPQLNSSLPILSSIQSFSLEVHGHGQSIPKTSIGGYVFQEINSTSGAISKSLEMGQNRVVIIINEYTRWRHVWAEVKSWFGKVLPIIGKRQISHVGLQYNDIFHWRGSPSSLNIRNIFLEDSPYIASNIFDIRGLWHSHHGYFIDQEKPVKSRLLENINVSSSSSPDDTDQMSFVISTVHRMQLPDEPNWVDLEPYFEDGMVHMHNRNKEILKKILTPSVLTKINLT